MNSNFDLKRFYQKLQHREKRQHQFDIYGVGIISITLIACIAIEYYQPQLRWVSLLLLLINVLGGISIYFKLPIRIWLTKLKQTKPHLMPLLKSDYQTKEQKKHQISHQKTEVELSLTHLKPGSKDYQKQKNQLMQLGNQKAQIQTELQLLKKYFRF